MDVTINLAAVLLAGDRGEEAESVLRAALTKAEKESDQATIERMLLTAQDPDFEQRFGDLSGLIEAEGRPSDEDMEFLEDVLEQAPSFAQAYILLAKAYQYWNENETALEVLLDGQKHHPDNPDLLDGLAEALWQAGEGEVAFKYINKGLQSHPNHIPLLVRAGRYLFDNDQLADARVYLARAEALDPNDPVLGKARVYIANEIGNDPVRMARLKGQPDHEE
jgi:tetratricopeptide (TPR) repeat protein